MEGSTEELVEIFKLKIKHFGCIYTLMRLYILITKNIYINSIYFATKTCETTVAGLINFSQKHIDVGPTRTVLSGCAAVAHIKDIWHALYQQSSC